MYATLSNFTIESLTPHHNRQFIFWDADSADQSGVPLVKKGVHAMTVEDVVQWVSEMQWV